MNLGRDTIDELFQSVEREFTNAELQRLLLRYSISGWERETTTPKMIVKSLPYIHSNINGTNEMATLLQYILAEIHKKRTSQYFMREFSFSETYPTLINSLLRDGYKFENFQISRTIPRELEESNVPDELTQNLNYYQLHVALGHLEQAQLNYRSGNWASANAMVRSCVETVLIFITSKLDPQNTAASGGEAITKLTTLQFFREDINEVDKLKQPYGFIGGLWKMLHPHGSHPGLSEEEDSTFRYHVTLVSLNYYLKRLKKIIPN